MAELARPTAPLEQDLAKLYANRFPTREHEERHRLWEILCRSFFSRYVKPTDAVLDVGAGYCNFINQIEARRKVAIDLNPELPTRAAPGVETVLAPLEQLSEHIEASSIDVALASNVFEHLRSPDALLQVLRELSVVLKPGGRLLIMQPNARALGGAFWDFFDHTLPLSERGMSEALELAGYKIVESRARFLPYTTKSRLPKWPWLIRLYLALPPAHWLFGRQMFLVAERPKVS